MTALDTLNADERQRILRASQQPAQSQTRVGQLVGRLVAGRRGTGFVRVPVM